jgi:hypothetical protein
MNISTSKSLVPAKNIFPVPKPTSLNTVSYDLYPRQYRDQVVFSLCVLDESDGNYGPDGRKLTNLKYAEFIDIYA